MHHLFVYLSPSIMARTLHRALRVYEWGPHVRRTCDGVGALSWPLGSHSPSFGHHHEVQLMRAPRYVHRTYHVAEEPMSFLVIHLVKWCILATFSVPAVGSGEVRVRGSEVMTCCTAFWQAVSSSGCAVVCPRVGPSWWNVCDLKCACGHFAAKEDDLFQTKSP